MSTTRDRRASQRILRLGFRDGKDRLEIDAGRTLAKLVEALEGSSKESLWVLPNTAAVCTFLEAVHELFRRQRRAKHSLGSLLVLGAMTPNASPVLHGLFDPVVGGNSFEHLPYDALVEVLELPDDAASDLVIGGWTNLDGELLVLVRGNLRTIVAPFSMFPPTDQATPDFRRLSFEDHGHTLRLGSYEASSDSILYELDPEFRRRLNARRRESERGLGPGLRRLRKQRGLSRSDFRGLSEKTIARIERGEIQRPNARTVKALEAKLGMALDQIAEF